jgi:uncharacterized membrane protein YfcA
MNAVSDLFIVHRSSFIVSLFIVSLFIVHRSSFIVSIAALAAGMMNAIAGGGTLLTFPALIWIGRNPIVANATNTVAIWPAGISGALGFRREVASLQRWLWLLTIPSLLGGAAGAVLLLHTPERVFARIVPLLIGGATLLLALQEVITRHLPHKKATVPWIVFAFTFQFAVGVYGGYFGAGMGILMLAALGLIGLTDLHQMNGLKNVLGVCINGVAAVYFIVRGAVVWHDAVIMAVFSIAGGFLGARLARRLGRRFVRAAVVVIGVVMTIALALHR